MTKQEEQVLAEVKQAYIDCWSGKPYGETESLRKLDFRASAAVNPKTAAAIMKQAVPHGYNDFEADVLNALGDCKITLAREGSVCIYVDRALTVSEKNALSPDEYDWYGEDGEWRLWWD